MCDNYKTYLATAWFPLKFINQDNYNQKTDILQVTTDQLQGCGQCNRTKGLLFAHGISLTDTNTLNICWDKVF
jgi:hypothetical protein